MKFALLTALTATTALALPGLSGTVREASSEPIDGATVTIMDSGTGKGLQRSSAAGSFSVSGLPVGEYLIKVEKDSYQPVLALVHLAGDDVHSISVVMLKMAPSRPGTAGAGSPLRGYVRTERSSAIPPKIRHAELKQKLQPVYPEADRKAGIEGSVRLSMIILPDGTVEDLVVLSAPDGDMALAALLAVRKWRYSPTYLDDEPVEASLTVDVNFQKR